MQYDLQACRCNAIYDFDTPDHRMEWQEYSTTCHKIQQVVLRQKVCMCCHEGLGSIPQREYGF